MSKLVKFVGPEGTRVEIDLPEPKAKPEAKPAKAKAKKK